MKKNIKILISAMMALVSALPQAIHSMESTSIIRTTGEPKTPSRIHVISDESSHRCTKPGSQLPLKMMAIPVHGYYSLEYKYVPIESFTEEASALPQTQKTEFFNSQTFSIQPAIEFVTSQGGVIETNGLKMTIPPDAVQNDTQFSIKEAADIQLPEDIIPVTTVYEIEPHNVRFNDLINLSFTLQDASEPVALFIQKDNLQDKLLKKWLVIEPKEVLDNVAVFEVRSFSFPFVGKINLRKERDLSSLATKPMTESKFQDHNIIRPGLNYRAYCQGINCQMSRELMIINRGFDNFSVQDEILDGNIKCYKCKTELEDSVNVKQIILFQASGEIRYMENKVGAKVEKFPIKAIGDRLEIYGEVGNGSITMDYKSFKMNVTKQPFNSKNPKNIAVVNFDKDGNPVGSMFDLGVDDAFGHVKLLIGKFYDGNCFDDNGNPSFEEGFTMNDFRRTVGEALGMKGFDWYCTEDEDDFLRKLPDYHVAWIIPTDNNNMKNNDFPDQVINFHKSGKGLMLWEDNDPVQETHTTSILQNLFKFTLEGNDPGEQVMIEAANCTNNCTFSRSHPITTGITNLYEGCTICRPSVKSLPDPIKVLATSSSGQPNIMYVNEKISSSGRAGRVVIDCGYTKLFADVWDTAGTARYVKNATCWLSGFAYDDTM